MKQLLLATLLVALALLLIPQAQATHQACPHHDCPYWAQTSNYVTPDSSPYWYDGRQATTTRTKSQQPTRTTYVYHNIHHPPRTWYVRYNDNYHQTRHQAPRRTTRQATGWTSPSIYRGSHFNVYY